MGSKSWRSRIRFLTCLILVAAILGGAHDASAQSDKVPGMSLGSFKVNSNGAATYSVPIIVPAGTHGLMPQLSLGYDSQSPSGLLGVGWSLGGLSAISRCPQTIAQDNAKRGVNYDSSDRFCMDGQRLMAISGTYGADNTEYRTELDTFVKIVSKGQVAAPGSGPQYFVAQNKNGETLYFGGDATSAQGRIEAQGKTTVRVWALSKIVDAKGNTLAVTYEEDSTNGDYRPLEIDYPAGTTGTPCNGSIRCVKFVYDDTRPDKPITYMAGSLSKIMKRLSLIRTYAPPPGSSTPVLVREYRLTYEASSATQRSRLKTISECGWDNQALAYLCLPTEAQTVFTYQNESLGVFSSDIVSRPQAWDATKIWVGDFNGDGKSDIVSSNNGKFYFAISNGDGTYSYPSPTGVPHPAGWDVTKVWVGDFNGDARQELVSSNNSQFIFAMFTFSGNTVTVQNPAPTVSHPTGWDITKMWVGDFNGDTRTDLVSSNNSQFVFAIFSFTYSNGNWSVTVQNNPVPSANHPTGWNSAKVWVGDFNGDQKTDLVSFNNGNIYFAFYTFAANNTSVTVASPTPPASQPANWDTTKMWVGDFNGDGLSDLVSINNGAFIFALSKGDGNIFEVTPRPSLPNNWNNAAVWPGDFNGDGKTDLLSHNNPNFIYAFSNGDGTVNSATVTDADQFANSPVSVGDFDGNAISDVVSQNNGNFITVVYNENNDLPDLLTTIKTNLGGTVGISYKPITDSTVYTKDSDAVYPVADVQSPFYVVDSHTASNGTGDSFLFTYKYGGAKVHQLGRGWLGFRWMQSTDQSAKVEPSGTLRLQTTSYFRQVKSASEPDFPMIGLPSSSITADTSGAVFSKTESAYEAKDTQPGLTLPSGDPRVRFPALTRTDKYECDGFALQYCFQTADEFFYDTLGPSGATLGNQTKVLHRGQVASTSDITFSGDEFDERTDWAFNATTWIQRPCHTTVNRLDPPNGTAVTLREKWNYYDGQANCVINGPGLLTTEESNLGGGIGHPANPKTTHAYDSFGNRTTTTNPIGCASVTTIETYTNTFPATVANCLGHPPTVFTWDPRYGVKVSEQDPNHTQSDPIITTYTFDALGRPTTVVGPLDSAQYPSVIYNYLDWGQPDIQRTETLKRKDRLPATPTTVSKVDYFDGLGRFDFIESTGPSDPITGARTIIEESLYDSRGLIVAKTPARYNDESFDPSQVWEYSYDVLGRQVRVDHPDTRFATVAYEPQPSLNRIKITSTDERGKQKIKYQDSYGRVKQIDEINNSGADTYTTTYQYDAIGALLRVTNHLGHNTTIAYDPIGRKIAMCDPNMGAGPNTTSCDTGTPGAWVYTYDKAGNLLTQTDAKGQTLTFDYDLGGRVLHKYYPNNGGTITYNYDDPNKLYSKGRLTRVDDLNGMWTGFLYNKLGQVIETKRHINGYNDFTMSQSYNALGSVVEEIFPDLDAAVYTYNEAGWLKTAGERVLGGAVVNFINVIKYTARGQKEEIDYSNGVVTTFDYYDHDVTAPDFTNFALKQRFTAGPSGDLQNLTYKYDEVGNVTQIIDGLTGGTAGRDFVYDDLNRLTSASGKFGSLDPVTHLPAQVTNQPYVYDAIGNILQKGNATYEYCSHPTQPAAPQYCTGTIMPSAVVRTWDSSTSTEKLYQYDVNGNTQSGAGRTFTWTLDNRVGSVTMGSATLMDYDYSGARLKKDGPLGVTIYPFPGYEVDPQGTKIKFFKVGNEMLASKQWKTTGEKIKYFYHNDHLGGVNIITDDVGAHNGARQQINEYDPWGKVSRNEGINAEAERRFTGQILDAESGLYYYGARYYDPELARFISPDSIVPSIGDPQSLNRYSYTRNNPVKYIDPTGHSFWSALGNFFKNFGRSLPGLIVGIAVGWILPGAGTLFANIVIGMIAGMAAGAVNAAVNGGNFAQSIGMGALFGGLAGGIGGELFGHFGGIRDAGFTWGNFVASVKVGAVVGAALGGLSTAINPKSNFLQNVAFGALGGAMGSALGFGASYAKHTWWDSMPGAHSTSAADDDPLVYNGRKLAATDTEGNTIREWSPADSGKGSCMNNSSCQGMLNEGPIPEGKYSVDPSKIQYWKDLPLSQKLLAYIGKGEWPGGTIAWGEMRVPIDIPPGTDIGPRTGNFFIHGGDFRGSAGCIDLTSNNADFFNYLSQQKGPIPLTVKYGQ